MAVLRVPWNIRQALVCSVQQAPGGWQVSLWKGSVWSDIVWQNQDKTGQAWTKQQNPEQQTYIRKERINETASVGFGCAGNSIGITCDCYCYQVS